jgi:hypothetical protein
LSLQAQANDDMIFTAIQTGNFSTLVNMLDSRIDLVIEDTQENYTKNEALIKIQRWLKEVKPQNLESIHGGESSNQSSYFKVAKLITENGPYRVFVYIENRGNIHKVKKIQIDKF